MTDSFDEQTAWLAALADQRLAGVNEVLDAHIALARRRLAHNDPVVVWASAANDIAEFARPVTIDHRHLVGILAAAVVRFAQRTSRDSRSAGL